MAVWYFLRRDPGQLQPLPVEEMEAFLRAEQPLPADEDQLVHYIGLEVADLEGTVTHLGRVWFGRCLVHADGHLNQEVMLQRTNQRLELQGRLERWQPDGGVLVDASDAFEARRLRNETRWEPSDAEVAELRRLVNERAGWNIL
jgi:hypothetical protein